MAGVKGKSGGARPNTGGARPNTGPKKKSPPVVSCSANDDPKKFLIDLMNDVSADARMRLEAAKSLMPFVHPKLGEGGKKDQKEDAAKKAGAGRFGASAPPKLVVNNK